MTPILQQEYTPQTLCFNNRRFRATGVSRIQRKNKNERCAKISLQILQVYPQLLVTEELTKLQVLASARNDPRFTDLVKRDRLLKELEEIKSVVRLEMADPVSDQLKELTEGVTSGTPDRAWYSVSSKGLLEVTKFVKDFSAEISGTLKNLGSSFWPDFKLTDIFR